MEEKIRIENVTKKFGSYAALDGISLSFEKGKIHGMIGRNGSGKTVPVSYTHLTLPTNSRV